MIVSYYTNSLKEKTINAPIGGISKIDYQGNRKLPTAILLENLLPFNDCLKVRDGYELYADGFASNISTLIEYSDDNLHKFLACSGNAIFDITDKSNPFKIAEGFNNDKWEYTQFGSFRSWLILCNGYDSPLKYDGVNITKLGIENITDKKFTCVHSYKNRLYFASHKSQSFFYGQVNAIEGTIAEFPLSRVARKGGYLVAIKSISKDGGSGSDDLIAFFMSSGEVIIYSGSNPGNANDWFLLGRYLLNAPLEGRAIVEFAGDIIILTTTGINLLSNVLNKGQFTYGNGDFSLALNSLITDYINNKGFQIVLYPKFNALIVNVPVVENIEYVQYGVCLNNKAVFSFKDINAVCFGYFNNDLYFASGNKIYKMVGNKSDDGKPINVKAMSNYSDFGVANSKQCIEIEPIIVTDGHVDISIGVSYDYKHGDLQNITLPKIKEKWDINFWDTIKWRIEKLNRNIKTLLRGKGDKISIIMSAVIKEQNFAWYDSKIKFFVLQ